MIGVAHVKLNFMPMIAGGCLKDMAIVKLGKCVWVPKNTPKEPVCFWDCLACALNRDDKMMRKSAGRSMKLRTESEKLRQRYYGALATFGEQAKCEMVPLCDVPKIAKALQVGITVYTLVKEYNVPVRKVLIQYDEGYADSVMLHLHLEKDAARSTTASSTLSLATGRRALTTPCSSVRGAARSLTYR